MPAKVRSRATAKSRTAASSNGAAPPPDVIALATAMRTCVMRLSRQLRAERSDESLTQGQLSALGAIESRGPMTPSQLAAFEQIPPPSVTRIIAALSDRGYIARTTPDHDRRQVLLTATPSGRRIVHADRERRTKWLSAMLETLEDRQRRDIAAALPHLEQLIEVGIEAPITEMLRTTR